MGKPSKKSEFSQLASTFVWVKLAIYAGMAFVAYRAYKANGNSLTNPVDGTTVTVDTTKVVEAGIEMLGFAPALSRPMSKSAKMALDNYLRNHAIHSGRT